MTINPGMFHRLNAAKCDVHIKLSEYASSPNRRNEDLVALLSAIVIRQTELEFVINDIIKEINNVKRTDTK